LVVVDRHLVVMEALVGSQIDVFAARRLVVMVVMVSALVVMVAHRLSHPSHT